jgi:hypothetical protein
MARNTFDVEQTFKAMDREAGRKAPAPKIEGDYEIEATGMGEWFAYRYEFKVNGRETFGYASTIEEARANIIRAQEAVK